MNLNTIILLILTVKAIEGQTACGPVGAITIAGAGNKTLRMLAEAWADGYSDDCVDTTFEIDGGGKDAGAGRVCANDQFGSPVMIGAMSRNWDSSEASTENGWTFSCLQGDESRNVAQLRVVDSISAGDDTKRRSGRNLFMNLHMSPEDLAMTLPYIEYGYSEDGDEETVRAGYVPLSQDDKTEMRVHRMSTLYHDYIWDDDEKVEYWCGPEDQEITIAGSGTVLPVVDGWIQAYTAGDVGQCTGYTFNVDGGGSGAGASRVCGSDDADGDPVMIGAMSRQWRETEATTDDDITYTCLEGDEEITVTQLPIGYVGVAVIVQTDGEADECISELDGLTTDQLRWMFSSFTEEELASSGWDRKSIPNSDGNDDTHFWSELNDNCPEVEIAISGPESGTSSYVFFEDAILTSNADGETFRSEFNEGISEEIVSSAKASEDGIAFFGYSFFENNEDALTAVAIANDEGDFTAPSRETIADGTYNPLSRSIHLNINNDYMEEVYHFLRFGFSSFGTDIVDDVGYIPVSVTSEAWQESWSRVEDVMSSSTTRRKIMEKPGANQEKTHLRQ